MSFDGFPERMLSFYEGLGADNSKAYWQDHKAVYDECVAAPMRALLDELGPEFGEAKFFRPYRDVRFAKDKTPYKTEAAAVLHSEEGAGALYLAVGAEGLFVAGGYYGAATDQAQRLRMAVANDRPGAALVRLLDRLRAAGWQVDGEQLKRTPKPWDDSHPRAPLLRYKWLTASRSHGPAEWLHTPAARDRIAEDWRQLEPLNSWLREHVGPSRTAPAGRR